MPFRIASSGRHRQPPGPLTRSHSKRMVTRVPTGRAGESASAIECTCSKSMAATGLVAPPRIVNVQSVCAKTCRSRQRVREQRRFRRTRMMRSVWCVCASAPPKRCSARAPTRRVDSSSCPRQAQPWCAPCRRGAPCCCRCCHRPRRRSPRAVSASPTSPRRVAPLTTRRARDTRRVAQSAA